MRIALTIARTYAGLIGGVGFLFGQLFVGMFSLTGSISGAAGIVAGVFGLPAKPTRWLVIGACVAGIVSVAIDAVGYYRELNVPGNSFGWEFIAPFVLALVFIGYSNVTASA